MNTLSRAMLRHLFQLQNFSKVGKSKQKLLGQGNFQIDESVFTTRRPLSGSILLQQISREHCQASSSRRINGNNWLVPKKQPGRLWQNQSYALMTQTYFCPQMIADVQHIVYTCLIYQDKVDQQNHDGLLNPLPILDGHNKVFTWISSLFCQGQRE